MTLSVSFPLPNCPCVVRNATWPHRRCLNLATAGETSKTASLSAKRHNGRQVGYDGCVMATDSTASHQSSLRLRRVRHLAFGIDSLSPSSHLNKGPVGNIAPADLQTVFVVPSRPKEAATSRPQRHAQRCFPCTSAPSISDPLPTPHITAHRHTALCVGRCLARPPAYSS